MRAAKAARSPCDTVTPVVNERRAGMEPCPYEWIGGTRWGRRRPVPDSAQRATWREAGTHAPEAEREREERCGHG